VAPADPWRFFASYEVQLDDDTIAETGIDPEAASVYVTVTAGETPSEATANLRAPIVIAHGRGRQVANQAVRAPVRAPLFA